MFFNKNETRIVVVVVLYQPDEDTVKFAIDMARNGQSVVAVINAMDQKYRAYFENVSGLQVVENTENLGLARALNQGCKFAFQRGATHVMLLDQDSRPNINLSRDLLLDLTDLENAGESIAAIGPKLVDVKGKTPIGVAGDSAGRGESRFTHVDTLATSGSLFSRAALETVGDMYEWLFIDDIDHEWCFRAQGKGYSVIRSNYREMQHNMGDGGITILGRYRPLHRSPIRHYYITRNSIYLCKQPYVRLGWRVRESLKLIYRIPVYFLISTSRIDSLKNVLSGIVHGLRHKKNSEI